MNSKEAKDLLVEQAGRQAAIQEIPLSDLEKRMMYFTEWDKSCENPSELNAEFEAQYDTPVYEKKIAALLHNAYKRIKKENPVLQHSWDEAIRTLRRGDHYILVLWRTSPPSEHPKRDFLIQVGIGVLIVFLIAAAAMIKVSLEKK